MKENDPAKETEKKVKRGVKAAFVVIGGAIVGYKYRDKIKDVAHEIVKELKRRR